LQSTDQTGFVVPRSEVKLQNVKPVLTFHYMRLFRT